MNLLSASNSNPKFVNRKNEFTMLEKSFTLLFYLKKPKNYRKGSLPVYLRITVDGIRKEISTACQCDPDRWNAYAGRVNGSKEDAKRSNEYLDTLQAKVYGVRRQLLDKNETIIAESLKNILKGTSEKMILEIFQQRNDQMKSLVGKDFSAATLKRYKTSFDHTKSFMKWKYGVSDIDIRNMGYEFISQYEFWLKTFRNCNYNTTIIRSGWLEKDPFVGFKMTKKEVVSEFLTEHEINTMASKKFSTERLSQVRDIFLFCCFTGLAFADVEKLKSSEIGNGIDGSKWIFTNRQKTNTISRIPLLPIALEIIEQYKNHPKCVHSEKVLPVLSNQKNYPIKILFIGRMAMSIIMIITCFVDMMYSKFPI